MTDNEGIKKPSYIKLTGILWGVCREQPTKIEQLESPAYELQEAVKTLQKPKPRTRATTTKTDN